MFQSIVAIRRALYIHIVFATTLLCMISLSSCTNSSNETISATPAPVKPTSTLSAKPTSASSSFLPKNAFSTEGQWTEVLALGKGDDANKNNVTGGTFIANKKYRILVFCQGDGDITIQFTPQGETLFHCKEASGVQSVNIGTDEKPPVKEPITIVAKPENNVKWQASVQVAK